MYSELSYVLSLHLIFKVIVQNYTMVQLVSYLQCIIIILLLFVWPMWFGDKASKNKMEFYWYSNQLSSSMVFSFYFIFWHSAHHKIVLKLLPRPLT